MSKEFVTYKQALALKELRFNEPCFGRYHYKESYPMLRPSSGEQELVFEFGQYNSQTKVTILAPLKQQVFRFFRDRYELHAAIYPIKQHWECDIRYINKDVNNSIFTWDNEFTYEEAESACIDKLIEIVKTKHNE